MANMEIDENSRQTLGAIDYTDSTQRRIVPLWADPVTHRLLVEGTGTSGSGAPGTTPTALFQFYIDTNGKKLYVSMGTTNSNDWVILN